MKRILVAIDGSERQRGVLDAAIGLAQKTRAKLVLFRSVGIPRELPEHALGKTPDEVVRLLEDRARAELGEQVRLIDPDLVGGVRIAIGVAWQAINLAARDEDADVIVIGSHGYGAVDRVLGTTAAKVVNHADRSVLVVRAPERFRR